MERKHTLTGNIQQHPQFESRILRNRRDVLVVKAIEFDQGRVRMLWWHLRGIAIQTTYVTFWSRSQRDKEFNRLISKMRDCPPSL